MAPPIPVVGPVNSRDTRGKAEVTFSADGLSASVLMYGKKLDVDVDPVAGPKTMQFDGSMKPMRYDELPMHNKHGIPWRSRTPTEKEVLVITAVERTQKVQAQLKASGRLNTRLPDFLEDMGTAAWRPYTFEEQNSLLSSMASKAWDWDDPVEDLEEQEKTKAAESAKKEAEAATAVGLQRGWQGFDWGWMPDPALLAQASLSEGASSKPTEPTKPDARAKSRFSPKKS